MTDRPRPYDALRGLTTSIQLVTMYLYIVTIHIMNPRDSDDLLSVLFVGSLVRVGSPGWWFADHLVT